MSFMEQQITECQLWAICDTTAGIEAIPIDELGINLPDFLDYDNRGESEEWVQECAKILHDYLQGSTVFSIDLVEGYGARLSAPGYLDCTDWTVFTNEQDAQIHLDETYGDD